MKHLYGLLLPFVVLTGTFLQAEERVWEVTCGLPQQDNPLLDLMPYGYSGPFLYEPAITRSWIPSDEELVNGQILALLPPARLLKCNERAG